jgi:hypothetical protein
MDIDIADAAPEQSVAIETEDFGVGCDVGAWQVRKRVQYDLSLV